MSINYESQIYYRVREMHEKFKIDYNGPPRKLDKEERNFRIQAMREELEEYASATTLVDEYDALLDLMVFAVGTLYRQGLPLLSGYQLVMSANMRKEVGANKGKSRGEFKADLRKPQGWTSPEGGLKSIINDLEFEHARRK